MSAGYKSKVASSLMLRNLVSLLALCSVQWQFGYLRCLFLTELSWDKLVFFSHQAEALSSSKSIS